MKTIHFQLTGVLALAALTLSACDSSNTIVIQGETVYAETVSEVDPAAPLLAQAAAAEPPTEKPAAKEPAGDNPKPKTDDANPSTRPKADRTPRKPGEPIRITFDNIILGMQKDMVYRPWMLNDDAKDLEGQKVSITGVMYEQLEGGTAGKPTTWFVLLRNKECKYGAGGQADHLAEVELKTGSSLKYTHKTLRVEGTLRIVPKTNPKDGNTLSLYTLEDATAKEQ